MAPRRRSSTASDTSPSTFMYTSAQDSSGLVPICIVVMLAAASPRMVPITPMRPGASTYSNTSDVVAGAISIL